MNLKKIGLGISVVLATVLSFIVSAASGLQCGFMSGFSIGCSYYLPMLIILFFIGAFLSLIWFIEFVRSFRIFSIKKRFKFVDKFLKIASISFLSLILLFAVGSSFAKTQSGFLICPFSSNSDACYKDLARNAVKLSICEKIKDSDKRENCYLSVVYKAKLGRGVDVSSDTCDTFKNIKLKDQCYIYLLEGDKYVSKADYPLFCENIKSSQDQKDVCYSVLAEISEDVDFCQNVSWEPTKERCISKNLKFS